MEQCNVFSKKKKLMINYALFFQYVLSLFKSNGIILYYILRCVRSVIRLR